MADPRHESPASNYRNVHDSGPFHTQLDSSGSGLDPFPSIAPTTRLRMLNDLRLFKTSARSKSQSECRAVAKQHHSTAAWLHLEDDNDTSHPPCGS